MLPFYDKIKHGDSIVTLYFVREEAEKNSGNPLKVQDTFVRDFSEIIRVLRLRDKFTAHLLIEG